MDKGKHFYVDFFSTLIRLLPSPHPENPRHIPRSGQSFKLKFTQDVNSINSNSIYLSLALHLTCPLTLCYFAENSTLPADLHADPNMQSQHVSEPSREF
jgi:hypothetical protein